MEEFKNEKLLNIIHFSKDFTINDKKENIRDITNVNNIIKNNISNGYEVVKMFGIGLHGKLYLLKDKFGKQYICKKLSKSNITQEKKRQLDFELKLLKYLSSNQSVKKHINRCINYHISNNDIFTIFPITDAISLSKFKGYLDKVTPKNKIEIVKKLVKNILQAISKIHKLNISHQNINDSNILVSINQKDDDIIIKFTEFGLGCGYYKIPKGDEYNIKDNKYILQKCYNPILNKEKNHRIVKTDLEHLKNWPFPASLMMGFVGDATSDDITIDPHELEAALWVTREDMMDVMAGQHATIRPARKGAIAYHLLTNWLAGRLD